jgi:hypothetical protein
VKHTTRQTKIRATRIRHRVNVNTLAQEPADQLQMNEIAEVEFEANVPLFLDPYSRNRTTGSLILIDPLTNATLGAGMIEDTTPGTKGQLGVAETVAIELDRASSAVAPSERDERHGHYHAVVLSGNQPEVGAKLERALFDRGFAVLHLDGRVIAPQAISDVLQVALTAGLVVIYSGEMLAVELRTQIATSSSERFFDATALAGSEDRIVQAALAFAQTLLVKPAAGQPKKVN